MKTTTKNTKQTKFMKKKIEVTQEDIRKGKRFQNDACPVALAVQRTLKRQAIIGDRLFSLYNKRGLIYTYGTLPKAVQLFINKFDNKEKVEPFGFTLKCTQE